jgi:hypothetical protein
MDIKKFIGLAKPKVTPSIKIGGETYSIYDEVEIVWEGDRPSIFLGEEDNWYALLHLDNLEWEGKYADGDFDRNDEYVSIKEVYDIMIK